MTDLAIHDTVACLDRALARIAVAVTGNSADAEALVASLGRGETTAATHAFLSEGAAFIRARLLLAAAMPAHPVRTSLRKSA